MLGAIKQRNGNIFEEVYQGTFKLPLSPKDLEKVKKAAMKQDGIPHILFMLNIQMPQAVPVSKSITGEGGLLSGGLPQGEVFIATGAGSVSAGEGSGSFAPALSRSPLAPIQSPFSHSQSESSRGSGSMADATHAPVRVDGKAVAPAASASFAPVLSRSPLAPVQSPFSQSQSASRRGSGSIAHAPMSIDENASSPRSVSRSLSLKSSSPQLATLSLAQTQGGLVTLTSPLSVPQDVRSGAARMPDRSSASLREEQELHRESDFSISGSSEGTVGPSDAPLSMPQDKESEVL